MKNNLRKLVALLMTFIMVMSCTSDALAALVYKVETSGSIGLRTVLDPSVYTTHTFEFYNGNSLVAKQIVRDGQLLLRPETPELFGHKFLGWSASTNGGAPYFTDFGPQTVTETKTTKLYADFAQVYYVFFMDNAGRVSQTKEGKAEDVITVNDVTFPVAADEGITGWYSDSGLTTKVTSVKLKDTNITLYPKVEKGHWITYNAQGGTYLEPAFVGPNATTVAPTAPTRPGYTFKHWSATESGTAFTFGQTLSDNIALYAVWTANKNTT